jgi:hypothetical protein
MKAATVHVKASELLALGKVTGRIAELRKVAEGKALLTLEAHMVELAGIRDEAKKDKQFSCACRAEELRGRLSGLYAEQPQASVNQSGRPEASQAVAHVLVQKDELAPLFERYYGRLKTIEHQPTKSASGNGANGKEN